MNVQIGVIGGSGVYQIESLKKVREVKVRTPFGAPSDSLIVGDLAGIRVAFLPRHGRGHRLNPSEINYRANIYALKSLGVENVISVSACGSLKEEIRPRDMVFPDQFFDRTKGIRASTFFEKGLVGHVMFGHPFHEGLRLLVANTAQELGYRTHPQGTYVCMEGPQFSTKAESNAYRAMGFDIVGMTNLTEAKLAREAELRYATVGLVTDYDVWREGEEVSVDVVIGHLHANSDHVKRLIGKVVPRIVQAAANWPPEESLKFALMTDPGKIPPATRKKLALLVKKYLPR